VKVVWPSASRAWDLLNGVKLGFDKVTAPLIHPPNENKRPAEDDYEKISDYLQHEAFGMFQGEQAAPQSTGGVRDLSARIMVHMLGLDVPGIEPSTSFYPGYEWWPRNNEGHSHSSSSQSLSPAASGSSGVNVLSTPFSGGMTYNPQIAVGDWPRGTSSESPSYSYHFNHYGV
jgi:hypothetical protein